MICSKSSKLAILLVVVSAPAHAYLDPGTGSVILQAVIATIAAGFATLRLWKTQLVNFFYRIKGNKRQEPFDNDSESDPNPRD